MGYEVKLLVGENNDYQDADEGAYFMVAATIDLCKIGANSHLNGVLRKNNGNNYYYYADDGNTKITDDLYGDRSDIHSLDEIIGALKKDVEQDDYRRFKWALSLLESIKKNNGSDFKVMFYGH